VLHLPQQPGKEEAWESGAGRRSEEGLTENTRWAQWSVCRAITQDVLSGVVLMQIIYTDNSAAAAGGCERWYAGLNHRGHDIVWG